MVGRIEAALSRALENKAAPGIIAMASRPDGTFYEGAVGHRAPGGAPMTVDTVCRIASMTKAVTAAAAMQLVEQGRIGLDQPMGEIAPTLNKVRVLEGFDESGAPITRVPRRPVTLRHLLTHTSGFSYDVFDAKLARYCERTSTPSIFTLRLAALEAPLMFDPGEGFAYGIGIDWAGRIVETVSGQDLETYLQQHLLQPLGMSDTSFRVQDHMADRLSGMHARTPDGGFVEIPFSLTPADAEFDMGGGGLYSTAADYTAFMRMILNGGALNGRRVLKPETVRMMGENAIGSLEVPAFRSDNPDLFVSADMLPGQVKKWGLSFLLNTEDVPGGRAAGAMMWAGLFNSYYWIDPASGVAATILMQLLPFYDTKAVAALEEFERAVYQEARQS
jgi:CubicO group peptidase (beta-lactamase class C family)